MTYQDKIIIDCSTGEITAEALTAKETAQRDAERAAAEAKNLAESYHLSPSILIIPADGVTSALLTVASDPADETAELLYAGFPLSVPLINGRGSIQITSDIPGMLLITGASGGLADCKVYVYAGQEVQ